MARGARSYLRAIAMVAACGSCGPTAEESARERNLACTANFHDPQQVALCHRFEQALELGHGHAQLIGRRDYMCLNDAITEVYCAEPRPEPALVEAMQRVLYRTSTPPNTLVGCVDGLRQRMDMLARGDSGEFVLSPEDRALLKQPCP
jgi:hypothetical protein